MRAESRKRGLISILLVLTLVLSMTFAAVPVLAPAIISWPEGTMEVPPGENFTFTHRLRWDETAPGFYIITITWDYGGDNSWHFTLVENRAYFDNGDPIVATASITDKMGKYTVQVAALAGDMRDGYFTVDITLRASGPDGSPHAPGDHQIFYYSPIRCNEESQKAEYPAPVTVRVLPVCGVDVTVEPKHQRGTPGTELTFLVEVHNTGNIEDNYLLSVVPDGWPMENIIIENDRLENVQPSETKTTSLSVHIPENAEPCTHKEVVVVAESEFCGATDNDNALIQVVSKYLHSLWGLIDLENSARFMNSPWHELYPNYCDNYILTSWEDTGEPYDVLSPCDQIGMTDNETGEVDNYHVKDVTVTILISKKYDFIENMYLEFEGGFENMENAITRPVCTQWHEIWPVFSKRYHLMSWEDENWDGVLGPSDQIEMMDKETGEVYWYHVDEVATDIIICQKPSIVHTVEVTVEPKLKVGLPCTWLEYTVTVTNTGNVDDTYDLSVSDNAVPSWADNIWLENNTLTVPASKNRTTMLHVHIPENAILGTRDDITVTATPQADPTVSASDTCVAYAARVIYPIHDAYVWDAGVMRDNNYNTDNLKIGVERDHLIWAWLMFDLSGVPFGHRVENARLWLHFHDSFNGGSPGGIAAHFSDNDDWREDNITWNNMPLPSINPTATDNIPQFSDIGWKSLTLTQDVGRELDGDEKVSWCLKSPENVSGDDRNIAHSKDYENALYRPYLEIIHVPVYRVSILISPPENNARPGENVTFTVTVKNMGAFEDNYDLTASDNENWGLTVPPTLLTVPSGENRTATLNVTIPENAVPCTRDNIIVTATSQGDNTVKDNASCTAHAVIAPPKLLTPSDGISTDNNTPTFRWENTSVADNYEIWVDNDPGFSSPEENRIVLDNYYAIADENSLPDDNYSWKVRAYLGADVSDFSEVWTFIIDTTPPAKPNLAWPVDGENINNNTPNLDWEKVEENALPVVYQVFISDNFEFPYENRSPWVENDNWIVSPALSEGVWYWRVRARDNVGNVGENSDARSFRVDVTAPSAPTLLEPVDGTTISVNTPTFRWTAVTVEDSLPVTYDIEIDNDHNFASPENSATGLIDNTYTPSALADENYSWHVRAVDNAGNDSAWSSVWTLLIKTIVRGVNVSVSPALPESKSGAPGENITFTVTVTNEGNVEDTYDLTATDSLTWGATVSPTSLTIDNGAENYATLSVVVPLDAGDEDLTIITIEVKSTEDPWVSDSTDAHAQATVQRKVRVSISPESQSGLPGEPLTYTIIVINTGNVADNYDLAVSDNAGWGPTLSKNSLEDVQPGENKTATLSVTIPENVSADAEDEITVTATSTKDTEVSASASCIATVTVVRGVEVSISPENQKGPPKGKLEYTVTIVNKGNIEDNYSLTVSDNENWGQTISPTSLTIPSNDSKTAKLNVTIPEDAENGTKDNVTVTATSHGDNTVKDNASCIAQAFIVRGVEVSIDPSHSSDVPGETLTYTVTVTNTGNVADNYKLTISDNAVPSWNPTVSPTSLTITAGKSDTAMLSVTIPSGAEHDEKDDITVTATSTENAEVSASASCEAEVSILRRVEVSISPGSGSGEPGTSLTYSVTVRNTGLIDDTYTLRAVGKEGWSVSIEPDSLIIAAGASDNATLRVVISPDAPVGDSMTTYVNVQSGEDPTVISTDTCRTVVTGVPEGPELELPIPLAISMVLISAAIIVPTYLLRGRPKKAARRRVLRDVSLGPRY